MQNNIKIITEPNYIADKSNPIKSYYFFSYKVKIKNNNFENVQLLSRYWKIVDGEGACEDIHGPGVIGRFPIIKPEETFVYTSFCPLNTPLGFMEGSFRFKDSNKHEFDIIIKRFRLIAGQILN